MSAMTTPQLASQQQQLALQRQRTVLTGQLYSEKNKQAQLSEIFKNQSQQSQLLDRDLTQTVSALRTADTDVSKLEQQIQENQTLLSNGVQQIQILEESVRVMTLAQKNWQQAQKLATVIQLLRDFVAYGREIDSLLSVSPPQQSVPAAAAR